MYGVKALGLLVLIAVVLLIGPLISIWALNTLFGLGIAYTFWTWLAMLCVHLFFHSKISIKR